jgi:hypothetical protein
MQIREGKTFGAHSADKQLEQLTIKRRITTPHGAEFEILYCGS